MPLLACVVLLVLFSLLTPMELPALWALPAQRLDSSVA